MAVVCVAAALRKKLGSGIDGRGCLPSSAVATSRYFDFLFFWVVFAGIRRELLCPDAKASPANVTYKLCARLLGLVWFVLIMLLGAIMNLYYV